MSRAIDFIFQFQLIAIIAGLLFFIFYSFFEKEKKAAQKALIPFLIIISVFVFHYFYDIPLLFQVISSGLLTIIFVLLIIPFGNNEVKFEIPENKFDERDIMFSRMELKENTEKFNQYYKMNPENKEKDDKFRKEPGLLSQKSKLYNPFLFNAAAASFSTVDLLQPLVETKNHLKNTNDLHASEITDFIKHWALKLGAADIGFTILKPHHLYSYIGRGKDYGKELQLNHKYAIAFTVEMSHDSMQHAPQGTIITESSQQYLNAGTIAVQIAEFIRNTGFDARAHIDANYRVICPAVAMDAGLGTIGRMGLLMTPKQGPRVRIGVVTTNLEVPINKRPIDSSMIHFCEICKKCAVNCPSGSISFDTSKNEKKYKRWLIDHESCFTYWTKVGTDCGRCIAVCPYAHNNNLLHNLVRHFLKINPFNRWIALKLDNFFYNIKPPLVPLKNWMKPNSGERIKEFM